MTYRVNRALGYQPWGVTNPWVFANYGQPQRKRGYVSPMVFQTAGPYLKSAHLGDESASPSDRMERYALIGISISAASLLLGYLAYRETRDRARRVRSNRRRHRRRSRRRTSR